MKFVFNPFTNLPDITASVPSDISGGTANSVAGFNASGVLESIPNWSIDTNTGGLSIALTDTPADEAVPTTWTSTNLYTSLAPTANLVNLSWQNVQSYMSVNGINNTADLTGINNIISLTANGATHLNNTLLNQSLGVGDGVNPSSSSTLYGINQNIGIRNNHTAGIASLYNAYLNLDVGSSSTGITLSSSQATIDGTLSGNLILANFGNNINAALTGGAGVQGVNVTHNLYANVQYLNGFSNNSTIHSGGSLSNYIQAFTDSTNIQSGGAADNGYTSFIASPNFNTGSSLLGGYVGLSISPNISATVTGNGITLINLTPNIYSGMNYANSVSIGAQFQSGAALVNGHVGFSDTQNWLSGSSANYITSLGIFANLHSGSTADQYYGINIQPVADGTITSNFTLVNIGGNGTATLPQVTGISIALGSYTSSTRKVAIGSNDGVLNINTSITTQSNLGVDSINLLTPTLNIQAGSPIVNTTVFGHNLANLLIADDNFGAGSIGMSLGAVAYVGQTTVATGKTVDTISMAVSGGQFSGDGTTSNFIMYHALGSLPGTGTPIITNLYAFKDGPFLSTIASNIWGLHISDTNAENFVARGLAINTVSQKVSSSSIGLEVHGKDVIIDNLNVAGFVKNSAAGLLSTAASVNLATEVTGTLPIANGGTGQTTATAAFDALSPTTTKGDLIVNNGSNNVRKAVGTDGTVLTADSGAAEGVSWQTPAAAVTSPLDLKNLGLKFSVAANALTIALAQADGSSDPSAGSPVKIAFRDATVSSGAYNVRSATAATSMTVPSGATLGHESGSDCYFYVYALDNAGAIELAVSTVWIDDSFVNTSSAISNTSDDDSLYSTSTRTNVPIRLIGRFFYSTAPNGTYAAVPDEVALAGSGDDLFDGQVYSNVDTNIQVTTPTEDTWFIPSTGITVKLTPGTYQTNFKALVQGDFSNGASKVRELARVQLGTSSTPGTGLISNVYGALEFYYSSVEGAMLSETVGVNIADLSLNLLVISRTTDIYVNLKYTNEGGGAATFGATNGFRGDLAPTVLQFRKCKV